MLQCDRPLPTQSGPTEIAYIAVSENFTPVPTDVSRCRCSNSWYRPKPEGLNCVASSSLRKLGVFVSPSGVRSISLRHKLACFKVCLRASEEKVAREGITLTETHVAALKRKNRMRQRPDKKSENNFKLC